MESLWQYTITSRNKKNLKQPNLIPKTIRERRKSKATVNRSKEIIKIRAEMNEIEKKISKINETKSWFFEKISKIDKPLARNQEKKGERGGFKSIKLEMKKEKLQLTP